MASNTINSNEFYSLVSGWRCNQNLHAHTCMLEHYIVTHPYCECNKFSVSIQFPIHKVIQMYIIPP